MVRPLPIEAYGSYSTGHAFVGRDLNGNVAGGGDVKGPGSVGFFGRLNLKSGAFQAFVGVVDLLDTVADKTEMEVLWINRRRGVFSEIAQGEDKGAFLVGEHTERVGLGFQTAKTEKGLEEVAGGGRIRHGGERNFKARISPLPLQP